MFTILAPRLRKKWAVRLRELSISIHLLRRSLLSLVGIALIIFFIFITVAGPFISPYDPYEPNKEYMLKPPSMKHLCGTDDLGRDIFSRILHGAKYSLETGVVVLSITVTIGLLVGLISGFFRGVIDELIMRVTDIFLAFPSFLFAMAVAAALGPSLVNVMIALSFVMWPKYARLVRGQVLSIREAPFVEAARSITTSNWHIIQRHILPNCLAPVIITMTLDMGQVILTAAGLSFVGMGAQPPLPEWGAIVSAGRSFIFGYWWYSTFPGIFILLVVLGFNLLGDGLRDILDPRLRRLLEEVK